MTDVGEWEEEMGVTEDWGKCSDDSYRIKSLFNCTKLAMAGWNFRDKV
jgi:hypothetical protein